MNLIQLRAEIIGESPRDAKLRRYEVMNRPVMSSIPLPLHAGPSDTLAIPTLIPAQQPIAYYRLETAKCRRPGGTMQFKANARVISSDQKELGHVRRVVIDPGTDEVVDLV